MSHHAPSDELDELLCAARVALETDLELERREVRPDFAATVAAAHARDPEAVPAQTVAAARALAPVVELRAHREDEGLDEAKFEALLGDARALAEADIARRRLAGIPSPELHDAAQAPAPPPPSRRRTWIFAFAAVAVGFALLAPALWAWLDDSVRVEAGPNFEAEHSKAEDERHHGARERLPKLEQVGPTHRSDRALRHDQPEPGPDAAPAKTRHRRARATPEPAPGEATETSQNKAPSKAERAAELDRRAQALWAAGDLEGAAALFTKITELGGSGAYLDLAYGDLFTLARQRGDETAQLELWAAYLERLPKGRFADDARAGLCRHAKPDELDSCWRAYLRDFPEGVHRRAALRVLDSRRP
jgi:hypothetical protein